MAAKIGVIIPTELQQELFSPQDRERLNALGEVSWTDSAKQLSVQDAGAFLADCAVGVGSWGTPFPSADLLARCPGLRLWEHVAGTVKRMFGPHLQGRNLTIASCAPAIAENVAELAVGELLIGLRRVLDNAAANREGRARKAANSRTLAAAVIGVVGASHVGRAAIRLLKAFGSKILVYDPYLPAEEAAKLGATKADTVEALCRQADAVTLHTPALPATRHIIGKPEFEAMPDDAVFVNTSRGMCVDEAALIAELEKGRLFAFLDVTDPEPAAADSPLRRLPNVVLTSHIAGGKDHRIGAQAVDDIAAFLQGGTPRMAVTQDMLERLA
ncbi:MAG: hydroxyacid dehydrogenase [Kiritimatiellae bacterium]|nr:hydroxyacid dehydrogenase [Kiritimatiellia bacterium]